MSNASIAFMFLLLGWALASSAYYFYKIMVCLKPIGQPDISRKSSGDGVHTIEQPYTYKKMKIGGNTHQPNKEKDVALEKDTIKKTPTASLDKVKRRFRTAAWWCFGIALGLIGGKVWIDGAIYFGMPNVALVNSEAPLGPTEIWARVTWAAIIFLYVFLYAALWVAATAIRRKLSVKTAYDITMGDVRIIKAEPTVQPLLGYVPEPAPLQIEESTTFEPSSLYEEVKT
jgi:hypothetical protein